MRCWKDPVLESVMRFIPMSCPAAWLVGLHACVNNGHHCDCVLTIEDLHALLVHCSDGDRRPCMALCRTMPPSQLTATTEPPFALWPELSRLPLLNNPSSNHKNTQSPLVSPSPRSGRPNIDYEVLPSTSDGTGVYLSRSRRESNSGTKSPSQNRPGQPCLCRASRFVGLSP